MDGKLSRDGASIKALVALAPHQHFHLRVMAKKNKHNNGMNEDGTLCNILSHGRYPVGEQHRPGCHATSARTGWSNKMNVAVLMCNFLSRPHDDEGKPIKKAVERECITSAVEGKTGL